MRHVVTRALGTEADVRPDFTVLDDADCRLLLCSDGLSGELDTSAIEEILACDREPAHAAVALVERALAGRARDNITAVVVDVAFGDHDDDQDTTPSSALADLAAEITAPRAQRIAADTTPNEADDDR